MVDVINMALQVAMFFAFVGLIYCIVQVVDVIREERERLMWYRQTKSPVQTDNNDIAQ